MPFSAPLRDRAREFELHRWLASRNWPRQRYFRLVDNIEAGLREIHQAQPSDEQVVTVLAAAVEEEDGLTTHCVNGGYEIGGDAGWTLTCLAAAWMVFNRYKAAVSKGKWDPGA